MIEKHLLFSGLGIRWDDIWLMSGHEGFEPDGYTSSIVEELKEEIGRVCRPSYCITVHDNTGSTEEQLNVGGQPLGSGPKISSFLCGAEKFIVYAATAGREFEDYCRALNDSGDIAKAFFADIIGSAVAERTGALLYEEVERLCDGEGLKMSNSYCPGNCGWDVSDQHSLFRLLPPEPCGIELTESGLMIPVKSISGIIGAGREMKKNPGRCAICRRKDCHMRKYNNMVSGRNNNKDNHEQQAVD